MASTALELRRHIEEYLDQRIRSKAPEDRTQRETCLLETLQSASEDLLQQERVKRSQRVSELETNSEAMLAELLRINTEKKKLRRMTEALEEE